MTLGCGVEVARRPKELRQMLGNPRGFSIALKDLTKRRAGMRWVKNLRNSGDQAPRKQLAVPKGCLLSYLS